MGARNKVIAGDYLGCMVSSSFGVVSILTSFTGSVVINKHFASRYEVIDESSRKSAASIAGRALVGSFFGGIGAVAGALSAKNKGIYVVAISFKDGKNSLIEVDDKIYKAIVTAMF